LVDLGQYSPRRHGVTEKKVKGEELTEAAEATEVKDDGFAVHSAR
jgi:hypothetical protein